jgi:ribokinase
MRPRIAVVGSLNMDLVIRSPRIPQPGETILGSDFQTIPGGKGANQAVAAARLAAQVSMVGRLGNDAFARVLLQNLTESQVDCTYIQNDHKAATGVALIVVDDQGENSIVVASGANMRVSAQDVTAAQSAITSAQVLVLQLEIPDAAVLRAAQIARENGVMVILNPAPARELPSELIPLVDVLVPNESEAYLLSGLHGAAQQAVESAARRLLSKGAGAVVVTLGKQGAFATNGEFDGVFVEAFQVNAVDTTAAGDAFMAGLAVSLAEGHSLLESVRWGNACGALAAMRFGAQTSAPSRDEVELLLSGENADKIIRKEL